MSSEIEGGRAAAGTTRFCYYESTGLQPEEVRRLRRTGSKTQKEGAKAKAESDRGVKREDGSEFGWRRHWTGGSRQASASLRRRVTERGGQVG